ncbi:hypothetical protein MUG12_18135 [Escherichia albertii NBRC 107761 = DSM 17582]|uniref:hypothetical protein n=1 Tax=Escherichia TaxID=561 RepID=UPI0004FF881D|nr:MULTISPECIES: hypothetical protein [Escherichia]EKG0288910.1 hypothetical protein [Escherichia albertii]MCJ2198629.1 hypothetical protein [Escherichia albertii NBRC 107761 = DSM 17582]MCZ8798118.1 hypothetical protein [Escherichia albertii]GAL53458.1 hypothetical protein EA14781_026_00250 [Escherichia albertii NBRC 107761 = DSM 17582]HAH3028445.1 hypothetical protein [Escherichia albertii]
MNNLNNVVEAIFVVPGVSIVQPDSTKYFSTSSVIYTEFWWSEGTNKYVLETQMQSLSSCIACTSLNLVSIMAERTSVTVVGNNITSGSSSSSYYLSPAEISSLYEQVSKRMGAGTPTKVRYVLQC